MIARIWRGVVQLDDAADQVGLGSEAVDPVFELNSGSFTGSHAGRR
jgi:hypothetical protein